MPVHAGVAHNSLGIGLLRLGRVAAAIQEFTTALLENPGYAAAHSNLASALLEQGRTHEAIDHYRQAVRFQPEVPAAHSNLLLALHYDPTCSPEALFAEHRYFAGRHAVQLARSPCTRGRRDARRLRIGYVSPDLRAHSVAYFFEPVLTSHDRQHFEITCYSNLTAGDAFTERLRSLSDNWRSVADLADDELADLVRRDGIDILVDLAGHTAGNRLTAFGRRLAPVQITYLGYPDTTGLPTIDYRITDRWADPPGWTESLHSEKLLRLPEGFLCYKAPPEAPPVAPLPADRTGVLTFGFLNDLPKVNPSVIELWSTVLRHVPNSQLLVKGAGLADEPGRRHVQAAFEAHGIAAERLQLLGRSPTVGAHLAQYGNVDIALDTFPYNATTTTCDALWMGVPVITLAGRTHVARVGTSLLSRAGLQEFISGSPQEYVRLAVDLAGDLERLRVLRRGLRERMAASSIMDGQQLARSLEGAYVEAWHRWRVSTARPEHV